MKRRLSLLILISAALIICQISPILAQGMDDRAEIQKVVDDFFKSAVSRDLESLMKDVSANYFDIWQGVTLDYAKFKLINKNMMDKVFEKYVDYSISDLKITKLDIQGDKATLEMEFAWRGYNLDAVRKENGIQKRFIALDRENGAWKIVKFRRLNIS